MFKLYFDSVECKDYDWNDFKIQIQRDRDNRIVKVVPPNTLNFYGDCYEILWNKYLTEGYCSIISVEIKYEIDNNAYELIYTGNIFLTDCKFNNQRAVCEATITDNGYFAKIFNNSDIQMWSATDITKNGEEITAVTELDIDMFRPSDGAYNTGFTNLGTRKAFDLFDVWKQVIKFVSDDEMTGVSDWYDNLDTDKRLCLMTGYELRVADANSYKFNVSFEDIADDITKILNLWMSIDSDGNLRIEDETYSYTDEVLFGIDDVKDVENYALQSEYYSSVKMGSYKSTDSTSFTFPIIRFFSFQEEEYYLGGKCNIKNQLDLKCITFSYDTNIIEDILINNNDSYDDDIFIIQYDSSTSKATKNQEQNISGYYYNEFIINDVVANRYGLNNGMFYRTSLQEDKYYATATISGEFNGTPGLAQSIFVAEDPSTSPPSGVYVSSYYDVTTPPNFDSNNRINENTNVYTIASSGWYKFYIRQKLNISTLVIDNIANALQVRAIFNRSVNADEYVDMNIVGTNSYDITANGIYEVECELTIFCPAAETITMAFIMLTQKYPITTHGNINGYYVSLAGSFSRCDLTPIAGGEYQPGNPDVFKSSIFRFNRKLSSNNIKSLITNAHKSFTFNEDGLTDKQIWSNNVIIDMKYGNAEIEGISDINHSGQ